MTIEALNALFRENELPCSYRNGRLYDIICAAITGTKWEPIDLAPRLGHFAVFMPEECRKFQVAYYHPNINIIGNTFAFDLTKPTLFAALPPLPRGMT